MKTKSTSMTTGSVTRAIIAFALPLLLGNIFQQAYNIADTAIAGHMLGDDALSAIGSTTSLYSFLMMFVGGLNGGFALVIARYYGEENTNRLKNGIATMLVFNGAVAIVTMVLALTLIKPIMHLINIPDDIFHQAYRYIIVIFLGIGVTVCYNMEANLLRAMGNSVTPIIYLVISSVINIVLDVVFISLLGMGVMGASLATVIAQGISAVLCYITIRKGYPQYRMDSTSFRSGRRMYTEMLGAGITMAMMNCIFAVGSLILQGAINGLGKTIIAGHLAARKIAEIFMQPMITVSAACSTLVSQNYGAKKYHRIKQAIRSSITMELGMAVVFIALVYVLATPMINLVTDTSNPEIVSTARQYLMINLPFYLFLGVLYVLRTSIQSIGNRVAPLISSSLELGSKCVCAWWLTDRLGYLGVCVAEPISWVLGSVMLVFAFASAYKIISEKKESL